MASRKFHFFTDANSQTLNGSAYLNVQTAALNFQGVQGDSGAYGPVTSNTANQDQYRVTSLHTATGFDPTAYAVCDGMICVQKVDATRVNLVLKPLVQPPLNFAPVKYIIYKGILAASLIAGNDVAAATSNQLAKVIQDTQTKKNASAGGQAKTAPKEALGIGLAAPDPGFLDTDPIDNLFYRTAVAFQPPTVRGGWTIGRFDRTGFGVEILMEGLGFHHPLSLARQIESRISVATLANGANDAEVFDHWHDKEQVLGFMDPCAFYGSFFRAGVAAKTSTAPTFTDKAGAALYQDVLFPFANRNTAYLDIRNEHNFSLNYFRNYGTTIRLSTKTAPVDYYAGGWPILTLTAGDLTAGNTSLSHNTFGLQLPVGDNIKPLVFMSQGYRDINTAVGRFPAELKSAELFFDAFGAPVGGYTAASKPSGPDSLRLAIPNLANQGATTPVSCLVRLKYLKQQPAPTPQPPAIPAANYLDNLFWPLEPTPPFAGAATQSVVYNEEIYVNAIGVAGVNSDFIASIGMARDASNTYLFAIPVLLHSTDGQASLQVSLSGEACATYQPYPDLILSKYGALRLRKSTLNLSTTSTAPVAEFAPDVGAGPSASFATPDAGKLLMIAVSNSAFDAWKSEIESGASPLDKRYRTYLGVKTIHSGIDTAGVAYRSYELVLRGYAIAGGNLAVQEMNTESRTNHTNITVYALDGPAASCVISSGADGLSTACVPTNSSIQLKALVNCGGTYQWSTTSSRLTLSNPTAQTVTLTAQNSVSAARGAEKVQLIFTPTGGAALPPITRDVTVVQVKFSESAVQQYGYDDMDNLAGVNHHVSVKRQGYTSVRVDILGGGTADDLEFCSDDAAVATAVAPPAGAGAGFELTLRGQSQNSAQTTIRANCRGGPVCAAIDVNVYKEMTFTFKVAKIRDPGRPATALLYPNLSIPDTELLINTAYKAAVIKIKLEDSSPSGGYIDVAYDLNGSDSLTIGPGGSGPELEAVRAHLCVYDDDARRQVIVVKTLSYMFFLAQPAVAGQNTIIIKNEPGLYLSHLKVGKSYNFGPDPGTGTGITPSHEMVTIVSYNYTGVDLNGDSAIDGYEITLAAPLLLNHPVTDGVVRPVGGIRTSPIIVVEDALETKLKWVIGHEIGHANVIGYGDINSPTSLMHHDKSFTDHKIRFKELLRYDLTTPTMESQWEVTPRV